MNKKLVALLVALLGVVGCNKPTPATTPKGISKPTSTPIPIVETPPAYIDAKNRDWIISKEVGSSSESYYNKHYIFPIWPGGSSGVTWGFGFDAGYNTRVYILEVWSKHSQKEKLSTVAGKKGQDGKAALPSVKTIAVPHWMAVEVFDAETIPRYYAQMLRTFPGADQLCQNAQAGLLSLVFNRGGSLVGSTRVDMRNIVPLVPKKDYLGIASCIRQMNITMGATWKRQGVYGGLSKRRLEEAALVEGCAKN